jgi:hypothetical protein
MNTGMQDAANLGWKLAAAVAGWGGEALLDSYHAERHPVGRQVLRSSGLLVRLALIRPWWARMARNTIAPALLRLPAVADRVAGTISAIGLRYPAPAGADRRVGTRAPDIELRNGKRLYQVLRGGRFVLVGAPAEQLDPPVQVDRVDATRPVFEVDRLVLVRPDGYLGWIGTAADFPAWASSYFQDRRLSRNSR